MPRIPLILVLVAAAALAQTPNQTTPPAPTKAATSPAMPRAKKSNKVVAPTAPVITIHGLCESEQPANPGSKASSCDTVFSRQQFEALIEALGATTRDMEPAYYRNFAESYAGLLVYSKAGERAGVEADPRFEQAMNITRQRVLSEMYRSKKVEEARHVPSEEIEAYYKKNIDSYEQVGLDRLMLPRNNMANLNDLEFRAKAERLARELHERALKGEDFSKLEKEGFDALGVKDPPATEIAIRRGELDDKADKEVFALAQGEVSSLMDARGIWVFYKRTSRTTLSMEAMRDLIFTWIYRDRIDALNNMPKDSVHVDYNEAYFGPAPGTAKKTDASSKPAQAANADDKSTAPATLSAGDAVMTIHGLCPSQQDSKADSCATVVTKQQFETVATLSRFFNSSRIPPTLREIGEGYLALLVYGNAAEKAGLDKDPRFPHVLQLARMRTLTDMYRLKTDEEAHHVPAEVIESFYKEHNPNFEELQLRHLSVPREDKPGKADDSMAKKLANELRERAAQGEDMDKLTQEVYEKLGKKDPPSSLMSPIRRGALEENAEREVFALKPGQVSTVRVFPPAYVFYKLEKRRMIPLDEAKAEISQIFYRQRLEKQTKAMAESVRAEYNEDYFGSLVHADRASAGAPASASPVAVSHPAKQSFTATVQPGKP